MRSFVFASVPLYLNMIPLLSSYTVPEAPSPKRLFMFTNTLRGSSSRIKEATHHRNEQQPSLAQIFDEIFHFRQRNLLRLLLHVGETINKRFLVSHSHILRNVARLEEDLPLLWKTSQTYGLNTFIYSYPGQNSDQSPHGSCSESSSASRPQREPLRINLPPHAHISSAYVQMKTIRLIYAQFFYLVDLLLLQRSSTR